MKIMILAGEESGMIYAARLAEMLSGHEIRGYSDYGFKTSDMAVMGFAAVVRKLPYFIRVKKTMQKAICEWRPDVLCTIDYPGMNLKLAAFAKARGVRTVHVVCPQVWAWKAGRIPQIEASIDRLCCFLPFEPALFKPGFAEFAGHPLVETFGAADESRREKNLVALLPGSRVGEIERILPSMLEALELLPGARAEIPAANEGAKTAILRILSASGAKARVTDGGARDLLFRADCAAVASGTATLESALARCPTALVYKVSPALAWFARRVIKGVRHIGLVNVVWEKTGGEGEPPMPEFLQEAFTPSAVASRLGAWLGDPSARAAAVRALDGATAKLKTGSSAFDRIAAAVLGSV